MPKATYSIMGLQEFQITFEDYCRVCPTQLQRYCPYGKDKPFFVEMGCKDITAARDAHKYEQMQKLQKKTAAGEDIDFDKIKVTNTQIISGLWQKLVKGNEKKIRCISKDIDPLLSAQRAQDWWADFRKAVQDIMKECVKISAV
ncbi:MAG: hypothetical protein ACTSU5_09360 [Promethearchaeota archaeon]